MKLHEHEDNVLALREAAIVAQSRTATTIGIDSILESTMILNWTDVMEASPSGLLHMEYRTGADDFIEYLEIWSSAIRGHWLLVCEYWTSALWSRPVGLSFSNGYSSATLAEMLDFVMEHQASFSRRPTPTHDVMLQVSSPTEQEIAAAKECMREAVQYIDDRAKAEATPSAQQQRFRRGLEMLHPRTEEDRTAQETATNEGMAESAEARV
jgi:hypothetical protein